MKKYDHFLLILLGGLSALAFVPTSYIFILLVTYPLFFMYLNNAKNKKQLFFAGFSFGLGLGACSMLWLINALLIDAGAFAQLSPLIPLGFGLFFGLFFAFPALFCILANSISSKILIFCGVFTIFEWIRSWIFTGFPWNLTGSVWVKFLPVLQSASVFGVYGLTLFSLFWFSTPFLLIKKQYKTAVISITSFVVICLLGALRLYQITPEYVWGINLRLVQPNIEQTLKWNKDKAEENFMKHINLSKKAGHEKITHVLWSESASPFLLDIDNQARAMTMMALNQGSVLVTGSMRLADTQKQQVANSIFVINDLGEIQSYYDKSHLVPFGEYVPLRGLLPFEKIVPIASDLKAGTGPKTVRIQNAPPAGMLVCYEIIFPHQVVENNDVKPRPQWLINLTNDGWYGVSAGPYQHLASAQMRAVEEGLPIVRVAGTGISAVIYPWGQIMSSLPLDSQGVLDSKLPKPLPPPLYARLGNCIPLFLSLLFIAFGLYFHKKQKNTINS